MAQRTSPAKKTAAEAPAKAVARPAEAPAKAPAKTTAKVPAKAPAKTAARTAAKTSAKTPAKTPAKTTAKTTEKAAARVARPRAATASADGGRLAVRSGEDPWSAAELTEVRNELESELARLTAERVTLEESIADVLRDSGDGSGDDQADTGTKAFERDQEMTLLANTRQALVQTQHALSRLSDGSYGTCESCGEAIGKARLQAFPRATLCVACKQKQERR